MVTQISQDKFKSEVVNYKGVVLVDFYADWCGPCRVTGPVIEELANELTNIKFVKVNVDQNPNLANEYSIFSIPTFLIFKDGKIVGQLVGAHSKEGFKQEIDKITSSK